MIRLLSACMILMLLPVLCHASITTVGLRDKSGSNITNYPLTFGHVFKQGDVPSGKKAVLHIDGSAVSNQQFDLKTTYSDGSVRFAILSAVIPSIPANSTVSVSLDLADSSPSVGEMTKQQILDTGILANIVLSNLSGSGYNGSASASLRDTIIGSSGLTYWLKGSTCTEILVNANINNSLRAVWEVRFYPGTQYVRLSHVVDATNSQYRGNVGYDVDVQQGLSSTQSVYSVSGVTHYPSSRWRKTFWIGTAPPNVDVVYDLPYLISTGHIPNYDTSITIPESVLASKYSDWQSKDHTLMGNSTADYSGLILKYWMTTGTHPGVLPDHNVMYLLSQDSRARTMMLDSADKSAAAGFHWRETDSTKSFYEHPISVDERPQLYAAEYYITTYPQYRAGLPVAIGDTSAGKWSIDIAHQPSFAYIPYMVTGDYFYLSELLYLASWTLVGNSPDATYGRNGAEGLLTATGVQLRGMAWGGRTLAQAYALAPDSFPEKNYYLSKLQNNITYWTARSTILPLGNMAYDSSASLSNMTSDVKYVTSPWMEDYLQMSLEHMRRLGLNTETIQNNHSRFIVGRISDPTMNPYDGITYRFPAVLTDNSYVQSWNQAESLFVNKNTSYQNNDTSYKYIALAALAAASGVNSAAVSAYNWLKSQPYVYDATYISSNPTWAMIPDTSSATNPIPGSCGPSNGLALSSAPSTALCTAGTPSAVSGTGPWAWTCAGSGGGSTANCGAPLLEVPPTGNASALVACPVIAGFR